MNEYDQLIKSICKDSYYEFFKEAWKVIEPSTPFQGNWHVKYLCDLVQGEIHRIGKRQPKTQDLLINIPPRSLKSSIFTIYLQPWAWLHYPEMNFINASYSSELSINLALKSRRLIESEWYTRLFSDSFQMTSDQNVKSRFENDKTGVRRATSTGGTLTGDGTEVFIYDDPHKPAEAHSDLVRNSVIDWYKETSYTRLNDENIGLRVIVMQRLHENDLSGYVLENGDYRHINIPVEITPKTTPELVEYYTDGLFFPERFTTKSIANYKKSLGTYGYAGQMLQEPAPSEGGIIKRDWILKFNITPELIRAPRYFYSDTAYGKDKSDNSATACYSVLNSNVYIWDMLVGNFNFNDFVSSYLDFLIKNRYNNQSKCYFEPKASGISIVQHLKTLTIEGQRINVIEDSPPTESKEARVQGVTALIESGCLNILNNQPWNDKLIEELTIFPNGKNDDQVDVISAIIRLSQSNKTFKMISNY